MNVVAATLVNGCGTYNDPYVIKSGDQLELIADTINGADSPAKIRLPNEWYADSVSTSWHGEKGCGLYTKSNTNYNKDTTNTNGLDNNTWTLTRVRLYLASAYYVISDDITLSDDFSGLGAPTTNGTNGNYVFHGVIVGKKDDDSAPTVTNKSQYPLIYISNGSVVKNLKINVTENISKSLDSKGDNALYGYMRNPSATKSGAEYYGGVIGEIMGGDNIIDDVTVTYSGTTTLDGSAKHLIAEGGMVDAVVNGALIFRGSNSVSGRSVSGGGIYSNPYVGRVINGYAVYEKIDGREGAAPVNSEHYPIDTIVRNNTKLDVNYSAGTVNVPDAQSLYIMSLITQSIASTAETSDNENYNGYSPSYGYKDYVYGVARLGDYTDVGCGSAETIANHNDFGNYACKDSVNNYFSTSSKTDLLNASIPYIIYRYTKSYENDATIISKNYPARKMTSDNTKFWDITLEESNTFASMDSFKAFRGIGSVGIYSKNVGDATDRTAFKVATFNGNGNTINLHISLSRYERNQENYYHYQPKSLTQSISGDDLGTVYGHDGADNIKKLLGLGLFDCVMVKNDSTHEYQFKNYKLQGIIEDKVYGTDGSDITGTTNQTQLFCVGGVYGKRVNGNNSDVNFSGITFDGLIVSGAYSCGGLVGIDEVKSVQQMKIDGCNSTSNGISVTGGCFNDSNG